MAEIEPALTAEEWREREFEGHYGNSETYFYVDHNGRVFVGYEDGEPVVLNEGADAEAVLPKIAALVNAAMIDRGRGIFTHEDVDHLRAVGSTDDRGHGELRDDTLIALADRLAALLPPREP